MTVPLGRPTELVLKHGNILAIDPGVRNPAVALFHNGELVIAERVRVPGYAKMAKIDEGERCRTISTLIEEWVLAHTASPLKAVVWELPQIYRAGKSKGDPNGLVPLAMIGAGAAMALHPQYVIACNPDEWCRLPKDEKNPDPWSSPRGQLIWRRLSVVERTRVEATHDAVDAAGIGCWSLGRLDRVFVGSS